MVFAVGLTGGIGSGKTTVSDLFAALGADVIDTDEIARSLTAKGQPAVALISERFGSDVLKSDGNLNRERMREIAFADDQARLSLEAILHPLISQEAQRRHQISPGPYAIVVIPLLSNRSRYRFLDRIAVVDCGEEQQIARVMRRSKLSREQILSIMATQTPRKKRLAFADDVIDNHGSSSALRSQVEALHHKYLKLAR